MDETKKKMITMSIDYESLKSFFCGKKVLITGHTGFKGSWMCVLLKKMGASVFGYSLEPPTNPSLYEIAHVDNIVSSEIGDIRDFNHLNEYVCKIKPEIIIHMAAQPIVKTGYTDPRMTYETNVMGTVNIMESLRNIESALSFLNVTTDKVYENNDCTSEFFESDKLDGYDPYSNSKSCSELVTHSYKKSFFDNSKCAISTARAGNVIGGGDFATFRIVPDCVAAAINKKDIIIRNPQSIRPFQHVLEPLFAYLAIAEAQSRNKELSGYYNVGPEIEDCVTAGELATLFCKSWGNIKWKNVGDNGPHEAKLLRLNCDLIKNRIGYQPHWHIDKAIDKVVEWSKVWSSGGNVLECMEKQIYEYMGN